jgi:uncharacterized spore protein YtfJ
MTQEHRDYVQAAMEQQEKSLAQLDRLIEAMGPEAVFGKPLAVGDCQVFTASETLAAVGFGFGVGGGESKEPAGAPLEGQESGPNAGSGGGGGGGGMSTGRPVAVVRVDAEGVTVEPVVDITKIALAAFTTLGAMFVMFARMAKRAR